MIITIDAKRKALKAFYRLYGIYKNSDALIDRLSPTQINSLCRIVGLEGNA